MFIRILWPHPGTFPAHSVYECESYSVAWLKDEKANCSECSPCDFVRLLLDGSNHEIMLGKGTEAFVMNNNGKTIDRIIV